VFFLHDLNTTPLASFNTSLRLLKVLKWSGGKPNNIEIKISRSCPKICHKFEIKYKFKNFVVSGCKIPCLLIEAQIMSGELHGYEVTVKLTILWPKSRHWYIMFQSRVGPIFFTVFE